LSNTFSGTGAAPLNSPTFTGTVTIPSGASISGYAPLASPTFTGTVTTAALTATGNFTPSQTAGIVGTTTNNNANAGSVGEYVTATGTTVSMTNATPVNITSVSLTAGDWDVSGGIQWNPAGTTTVAILRGSTSNTSAANGTFDASTLLAPAGGFVTGQVEMSGVPVTRYSLASTTTIYLVGTPTFGVSTMTASGVIRARRVR
jgi:hypothetical protein